MTICLEWLLNFKPPFLSTLQPLKNEWNGHFVPRPFPRSEIMEFWESKHSSEPGCDRFFSSWQPAQSCILLLGQGKQANLSSGPLISQQNWIPGRRLSPFVFMQCQRQLKSWLMYFGTTELSHSHDNNPQAFLSKIRWCFSPWHFCTHSIPYSSYPCHCLISKLQNTWGWRRSPGALGSADPSPQLRAQLAAESSVQFWTSPRRETPLMTIMGQNSSNRTMEYTHSSSISHQKAIQARVKMTIHNTGILNPLIMAYTDVLEWLLL